MRVMLGDGVAVVFPRRTDTKRDIAFQFKLDGGRDL